MNIKNLLLLYVFIQVIGCTNTSQNNESTKDRLVVVEKKIKQEPEIDHTDPKIVSKYILTKTVSITMQDKYKQTVSCGSGFILDTGLVVTNKHVIENATYGFIDLKGNKHKIEGYVAIDKTNDLVILKVPSVIEQGIMQNSGELATGEKVYVAGNPQGLSETVSTGIISNPKRVFENKELIQISAPISPGSSGGPVVNERGELIGVAVGAITEGQNLNFAVPLKYIILLTKNVSQMKNLDIKTIKKRVDEIINTNPQEWIILRNFKYRYPVGDQEYDTYCTKCDYPLEEISILNKTEWPISSILVLLIAYDKTDTPVDYQTYSFFTDENILPSLAKTVRIPGKSIMKPGKFGKIEYRILDYKIHDD